jgi:hypothetical protein
MTNQFEYLSARFSDDYMMEADYDMALMMKNDCIDQLMALRTLQSVMSNYERLEVMERIRENLKNAEADIHNYESRHGKPNSSLESTI